MFEPSRTKGAHLPSTIPPACLRLAPSYTAIFGGDIDSRTSQRSSRVAVQLETLEGHATRACLRRVQVDPNNHPQDELDVQAPACGTVSLIGLKPLTPLELTEHLG